MADTDLSGLLDKIKNALNNLVHLRIVTAVGQISVTLNQDGSINTITIAEDAKAMSTNIDLLQGDITTVIDPEFVTGSYQSLSDFHAAREQEGHKIVQQNIEAVKALFKLVKELNESR